MNRRAFRRDWRPIPNAAPSRQCRRRAECVRCNEWPCRLPALVASIGGSVVRIGSVVADIALSVARVGFVTGVRVRVPSIVGRASTEQRGDNQKSCRPSIEILLHSGLAKYPRHPQLEQQ